MKKYKICIIISNNTYFSLQTTVKVNLTHTISFEHYFNSQQVLILFFHLHFQQVFRQQLHTLVPSQNAPHLLSCCILGCSQFLKKLAAFFYFLFIHVDNVSLKKTPQLLLQLYSQVRTIYLLFPRWVPYNAGDSAGFFQLYR